MSIINQQKCRGIDRHGDQCRVGIKHTVNGFCKFHTYMADYTDEQFANMRLCITCKKMQWFDTDMKTCNKCSDIAQKNREVARTKVIKCAKENCTFKKSKLNDWCMVHQLCVYEKEVVDAGKRPCVNYIRGCRSQLESEYTFSKCGDCLQKDRDTYRKNVDASV